MSCTNRPLAGAAHVEAKDDPRGIAGRSRYHAPVSERLARAAGSVLLAVAAAVVIVALAVVPFVHPAWVAFGQGRAEATAWTGYTAAELRTATDAILSDLVLGPPEFDVAVAGEPVLNPRERQHLIDVRGVFIGLAVVALGAAAVLLAAAVATKGAPAFWRSVRGGAAALGVGVLLVGLVGLFAFEAAFEVFHRLFFAGGTYTFDPRSERLVQLFPQRFWFETSLAVGVAILVLCGIAVILARRRLRSERPSAVGAARASLEAVG